MSENIKQAIRDHASIMRKSIGPRDNLAKYADALTAFVNETYGLNYPKQSDGYGVLHKECYSAIWDATRP